MLEKTQAVRRNLVKIEDMVMNSEKRKKLEVAGWAVDDASNFLGLTSAEAELVELKVLARLG